MKGLEFDFDRKNDRVEMTYSGEWNIKTVVEAVKEMIPHVHEWETTCFLNNSMKAKIGLSRMEIGLLPGFLEAGGISRSWKRAIVACEQLDDFRYFEKLSRDDGYPVRVFTDLEKAREWLKGSNL